MLETFTEKLLKFVICAVFIAAPIGAYLLIDRAMELEVVKINTNAQVERLKAQFFGDAFVGAARSFGEGFRAQ